LSRVVRRRWTANLSAPSREGRQGCEYGAYVPDPLTGRPVTLDGPVAADVAAAEAAVGRLDIEATSLVDTESLARILLRAESVASSQIEGLHVNARRLLRAEAARELGEAPSDVTAAEVLGNVDAMMFAVQQVDRDRPITVDLLLEVHRRLLAGSRLEQHGGRVRTTQNWIGGSDYNPCSAAFVPPPPEMVDELLADLVAFANDDALPAVAQAAMAHVQFETIHPFADGNGRAGRALIHLILRRRGLTPRVLPPVSLVLASASRDYVGGLTAARYRGPANGATASKGTNLWIGRFAGACLRAVEDAEAFERRARQIEEQWRKRLGQVRARSATDLLLRVLLGVPVITVTSAAELIGRSFVQTNGAVTRLADAGILHQITVGRRNRAFEAPDVITAFVDLERDLGGARG
jgi:Fic family protein